MAFCGQCGLQLPPGKTACPRCGTPTEPEFDLVAEDPRANDPTLAALSSYEPDYLRTVEAPVSPQQQKLVLRPDGNGHNFSTQAANDPTNMMSVQGHAGYQDYPAYDQRTPILPAHPNIDIAYPSYTPQTSQIDKGYQPVAGQYGSLPAQVQARKGKGRTLALLLILLGLLVILGALTVFVLKQNGLLGGNSMSPSQQAQAVITQYYNDINQQNYHSAYGLWAINSQHPAQPYDQFVAGYAHTRHDDITFDKITPLANGTVRVAITVLASEENTPGTVTQHTYKGDYTVGQQNGVWKILNGNFRQIN
jgi:hypothetical protein